MLGELEFLFSGVILGLVASISPGPLFALIVSETVKYGKTEGLKVAIVPLITDVPIAPFALLILSRLLGYSLIIGIISLLGACFLIYLGVENIRTETKKMEAKPKGDNSLRRAIVANLLNPNPYVFWLFVGGQMVFKGLEISVLAAVLFVLGFYGLLVGSNASIALIVEKAKSFIRSKYYVYVVRVLGLTLILFALFFAYEGLRSIGLF